MAIVYIADAATVEPLNGHLVYSFKSGGETIQLCLTRHASSLTGHRAAQAMLRLIDAADAFEPTPLAKPKRGRA